MCGSAEDWVRMMESLVEEDDEDWMRGLPASQEVEEDGGGRKRQKKVLTLDDLLQAERKEAVRKLKGKKKSKKLIEKLSAKSYLYSSSDEESEKDVRKRAIPKMLADLETQVTVAEEVEPECGAPVFGARLEFPSLVAYLYAALSFCFVVWQWWDYL